MPLSRPIGAVLLVLCLVTVSGCETAAPHRAEGAKGDAANGPSADAGEADDASEAEEPDEGPPAPPGVAPADGGEAPIEAGTEAGGTPCWNHADCREDEHCHNPRDWLCGVPGAACVMYYPSHTSCAGTCRADASPHPCLWDTCPTGFFCPPTIHGTSSNCQRRTPLGGRCFAGYSPCLEGLLCAPGTNTCVAGSSPAGTPCSETEPCYGDAWCVAGACRGRSQRGEACTRGSCAASDVCDDPDQFGPLLGTCEERVGSPCLQGCASGQYCDDVDGPGPIPGDCKPLIAEGQPCEPLHQVYLGFSEDPDARCASGLCGAPGAPRICARIKEAGEPCLVGYECRGACGPDDTCRDNGPGSACSNLLYCASGLWCSGESGTCQQLGDESAHCAGDGSCKDGLWCSPSTSTCETPRAEGKSCDPGTRMTCKVGLWCSPWSSTCQLPSDEGGDCTTLTSSCKGILNCESNVPGCPSGLDPPGCSGTCVKPTGFAVGARCATSADCETGMCLLGTCQAGECLLRPE